MTRTSGNSRSVVALLLVLLGTAPAAGAPLPRDAAAPDPRRGERLDGRAPPDDPTAVGRAVPRALLFVPRLALRVVSYPAIMTAAFVEESTGGGGSRASGGLIGFRPAIRFESGFAPTFGLKVFDRQMLGPGSSLGATLLTLGPSYLHLGLSMMGPVSMRVPLELGASFDRRSDALFAGTTGDLDGARARYALDRGRGRLAARHDAAWWLAVSGYGEIDVADYHDGDERGRDRPIGEVYDTAAIPRFDDGLRLLRAGARLAADRRDGGRYAGGTAATLDASYAGGILGDPSSHVRVGAEVLQAFDLGERVIVVRAVAGAVEPVGGAVVPFEELLTPGGGDLLRGLPAGLSRGHTILLGTLTYRWLIAKELDASVFVENGGAFGRGFDGLRADHLAPGVGIGLTTYSGRRAYWRSTPAMGLQLAYSEEGVRLLLSIAP